MNRISFLFIGLLSCTLATAQLPAKTVLKALNGLDKAFEQSIHDYHIPALGIAVVHEGEVVFAKGYGLANASTGELANENTLFAVASNTKAFTATILAQLVDEGKLNWDDRVRQYLPWFTLYDPYVSEEMRVRDLLCHRTGLATFSGDLLWYGTDHSRDYVLRAMKHLEPTSGFRTQFGYSNLMYMAAGSVAEEVTGESWFDLVQNRLLTPLEMNRSILSTQSLKDRDNVASPHNWKNGVNEPIDWVNWDNVAPAGSLISSAHDMAQWMIVTMDSGRIARTDERLWNERRTREMWTLHTAQPVSPWWNANIPSVHFRGYGLGWELYDLEGYQIVAHSGGYDGMISRQVLVPELDLGIIVLTNNNNSLPWAWGFDAITTMLGSKHPTALVPLLLEYQLADEAGGESPLPERLENAPPSHPLSAYVGTYRDIMYGDVEIRLATFSRATVTLAFQHFQVDMEHENDATRRNRHLSIE
jgi:CubicO group peptidase (beta-lactamase class C family)